MSNKIDLHLPKTSVSSSAYSVSMGASGITLTVGGTGINLSKQITADCNIKRDA
ncbi:putative orfan [Tupanvirus soda lake]|uniref:Orfan n=2 Tax=Tupanvirus TaxID=2094720 RepID=A0AC62AD59_9VIRU|nr:putative orfan [Tupanvirus soda lake]QKU35717.1 putative orfan [Tupanvirus soda lake]